MKDTSFIIKCTLPDKKTAETVSSALKHENINTDKIIFYKQVSSENDSFSQEVYNVPVFFGAPADFSQNTTPNGDIAAAVIMSSAIRNNNGANDESVCFSIPVNGDDLKKTVLILKRHHAKGMKAEKL